MYVLACVLVFAVAYTINMTLITVVYHRGLAHRGVELGPGLTRFVSSAGGWLTGLDPVAWVCMHRRHHAWSDQPGDPHSPVNDGLIGVALAQLRSYEKALRGLMRKDERYTRFVKDLPFGVGWINRERLWHLPYLLHFGIATGLGAGGLWELGACWFLGLMSHPVQGWLINSFGHFGGQQRFDTRDRSTNRPVLGLLTFGEGHHNNHHRFPSSARFGLLPFEVDMGFAMARLLERLGLLTIRNDLLAPTGDDYGTRRERLTAP